MTSGAREILTGAEAVIVDEIHAVAQSKRGAHLALTLERLSHLRRRQNGGPDPSSGSASRRPSGPLERIARFLVGPRRECEIVDAGKPQGARPGDRVPVEDMTEPGCLDPRSAATAADSGARLRLMRASTAPPNTRSIWPAIYPELLKLVREHTSTIIFVNNRRGAERLAKRLNELANEEAGRSCPRRSTRATPESDVERRRFGRSPEPTTARSPTRSARWSRSC